MLMVANSAEARIRPKTIVWARRLTELLIYAFVPVRLNGPRECKVRLRLEVLNALAHRPDGRATLDEVTHDAGAFGPSQSQTEQLNRFPEIGEIDIFTSGLVFRDNGWLQITDAGRSLLYSLARSSFPTDCPTSPSSAPPEQDGLDTHAMTAPETADRIANPEIGEPDLGEMDRLDAIRSSSVGHRDHPVVVPASDFRPIRQDSDRKPLRRARVFAALNARMRSVASGWKGLGKKDNPTPRRAAGRMGAAISAFLSFFALAACAAALIALVQTKSLKIEITRLDRELGSFSDRLEKLEHAEKARQGTEQQEARQNKPAADDKGKARVEPRADQAALNLSREDIELIREYIKPAPFAGPPAPYVAIGDPITGGTIPLPSPLTDKLPKLTGARFAIHDGTILIVRKDSRQVDAVLPAH
ncbi:hypothetical protein [Bradyrhizobium genosp. P]|uniref:hypothetical protein n=1 Tax=Bradyrhizobium genosp. P TaxID=83641 RepID=UPI003CE9614E